MQKFPRWPTRTSWLIVLAMPLAGFGRTVAAQNPQHGLPSSSGRQIVAYVFPRDHVIQTGEVAARKLTRINYAFAVIQYGRIVLVNPADAANLGVLVTLKQENPSLQVLLSVGGWLGSGGFSDAALTPESRDSLIQSAIELIERFHIDGLDIDWEYPGQTGAGNRFREEDKRNYTMLLAGLRKRFDQEERELKTPLVLTIAAGASDDFLAHTEIARVARSVDAINLMAYDYYEPGSEPITGNHAPLYMDPADPRKVSADISVRHFESAGVPPRKIILGVPFYGHIWGHVAPVNHGLFQAGSPVPNVFVRYKDIVTNILPQGFTRYWDASASVPYLYNADKQQFVSYEDPESLALKCAYVQHQHLAGVMFWEYGADASGALLDTIDRALTSDQREKSTRGR